MNCKKLAYLVGLATVVMAGACQAFETQTHALITREAFSRSALATDGEGSVLHRLGLERFGREAPFNAYWQSDQALYYKKGASGLSLQNGQHVGFPGTTMAPEDTERDQMREFLSLPPSSPFQGWFAGVASNDDSDPAHDTTLPVLNWVIRGVIREDDLFPRIRVFHHFFNPFFDTPIPTCPLGGCQRAVDWALGNVDGTSFSAAPLQNDARINRFSYRDAREMMWGALTARFHSLDVNNPYTALDRKLDSADRMARWATTFRALGDVVHLVEDMGQPQHTRSDTHSPAWMLIDDAIQSAFEEYTNARVLSKAASAGSDWSRKFFSDEDTELSEPPVGSYPTMNFRRPEMYFSSRGTNLQPFDRVGLADYSNRGFYTGGTMPGGPQYSLAGDYPLPFTLNGELANGYTIVSVPCAGLQNPAPDDQRFANVPCTHYVNSVPDHVAPGYAQSQDVLPSGFTLPNVPLAARSVFYASPRVFPGDFPDGVLAVEELDAIGNLTIPRAVGYATGMMNYFFRGSLTVSPPEDGLYAIVNHGDVHTMNAQGYPCKGTDTSDGCEIFGFDKIRVRVKNPRGAETSTESGTGAPITYKTGGDNTKLVAIVRYHRDTCYQPSLVHLKTYDARGTYHPPVTCYPQTGREDFQEIAVSDSKSVAVGQLDGEFVEFEFMFDDAIPINATDLFVQVAYRGPLGEEDDGIAVGTIDVSEPSFFANVSMTDRVLRFVEGFYHWVPWATPPSDPATLDVTHIVMCQDDWQIYSTAVGEQLPKNGVIRLAMLRDPNAETKYIDGQVTFQGWYAGPSNVFGVRLPADKRQATDERGAGFQDALNFRARGMVLGSLVGGQSPGSNTYDYLFDPCQSCGEQIAPLAWLEPDVEEPAGGFVSAAIGRTELTHKTACPIVGDFLPYRRTGPRSPGTPPRPRVYEPLGGRAIGAPPK